MKKTLVLLFCLCLWPAITFSSVPVHGVQVYECLVPNSAIAACTAIASLDQTTNTTPLTAQVWVAGFYGAGTLGGGLFQYTHEASSDTPPKCQGDFDDLGVTVIAQGHCYRRMFSGSVHLTWYGVTPNGLPDTNANLVANSSYCLSPSTRASCDVSGHVNAALASASEFGNGEVTSDGVSFVWWPTKGSGTQNLVIGPFQHLDCGTPPNSLTKQGGGTGAQPYYTQPNFIVLGEDPANSWLTTVQVDARAEISNCSILPSWYTAAPPSPCLDTTYMYIEDAVCASRRFVGTGLLMDDEGAIAHNLFITGFDVCAEATKSPRSHFYDNRLDCNTSVWSHAQKSGFKINGIISKEFFFQNFNDGSGKNIPPYLTNVTAISTPLSGGYGQMQLTYDTSAGDHIHDGDILIAQGFGIRNNIQFTGDIGTSYCPSFTAYMICNIKPNSVFDYPIRYQQILDSPTGCLPPNTYTVADFYAGTPESITVAGPSPSGCQNDGITIKIDNTSPAAANGRWIASCPGHDPCGGTVDLLGSNYAGPSFSTVSWRASRQFMTVMDATNVAIEQFACASGSSSAPMCTPPLDWAPVSTTITLSDPSPHYWHTDSSHTGVLTLLAGTTAGWPSFGYIQMSGELLCYDKILSNTTIDISARGCDGTSATIHSNAGSIAVAAPQVIGVSAKNNAVIFNATAASSNSGSLTLANDHHTKSGSSSVGAIAVDPTYKTWTADVNVGSTPDAILTTTGAAGMGAGQITGVANAWKILPGMIAADLTTPGNITSGFAVCSVSTTGTDTPASGTVTLGTSYDPPSGACMGSSTIHSGISSDILQFTGCGYPYTGAPGSGTAEPWLGNCAATAFFFGDASAGAGALGPNADSATAQGGLVFALDDHGHRRGLGGANWLDSHLNQIALANGSGTGAQLDPTSYGATFEDSARIDINDMSMQGSSNSFYTNSSKGGLTEGIGLVNPIIDAAPTGNMAIQTGPGVTTALSIVQAKGNSSGVAFFSKNQLSTVLEANNLPGVQPVYGQDTIVDAVTSTTGCANIFATGPQCQLANGQYTVAADSTINTASSINTASTINAAAAGSLNSSGWSLNSGAAGAATVTVAPNKGSANTGLGGTAGNISVIIAGNEDVRQDSSHHLSFNGTLPTLLVSPGGSSLVGNDTVGRITIGSGVAGYTATVAFAASWANKPICRAIDETTPSLNPLDISVLSTTVVGFTTHGLTYFTSGDTVSYMCMGYR